MEVSLIRRALIERFYRTLTDCVDKSLIAVYKSLSSSDIPKPRGELAFYSKEKPGFVRFLSLHRAQFGRKLLTTSYITLLC